MLPSKALANLERVYGVVCLFGSVPYQSTASASTKEFKLELVKSKLRFLHDKFVLLTTLTHTLFVTLRLCQTLLHRDHKNFFLLFVHFSWVAGFYMVGCIHLSLIMCQQDVKGLVNGLFKFYSSYFSMPGARSSAKEKRKKQKEPCLVETLVFAFICGGVLNTLSIVQIFLIYPQSYQFLYSLVPPCWDEKFKNLKFLFAIYELIIPGVMWVLIIFIVTTHIMYLLCTRDYLHRLRGSTRQGILKLDELLHHYRSIQILHNHYNESIAAFMPFQLFMVVSLILMGNVGTIRMIHHRSDASIPEMATLPLVSVLTGLFLLIFYQRAGELHHLSSFYLGSSKKGLYSNEAKLAKMYLLSCHPLTVNIGYLYRVRKFSVVRCFAGIVVGTARLSVLIFGKK